MSESDTSASLFLFSHRYASSHIVPGPICPGNASVRPVSPHHGPSVILAAKTRVALDGSDIRAVYALQNTHVLGGGLRLMEVHQHEISRLVPACYPLAVHLGVVGQRRTAGRSDRQRKAGRGKDVLHVSHAPRRPLAVDSAGVVPVIVFNPVASCGALTDADLSRGDLQNLFPLAVVVGQRGGLRGPPLEHDVAVQHPARVAADGTAVPVRER